MRFRRAWLLLVPVVAVIGLGGLPCHWADGAARAQGTAGREVRIDLSEWSLLPNQLRVDVGVPVRFLATNNGVLPHALAVEGDGVYAETDAIGSHQSAFLDVTFLAPGLYDIFCPVGAGQHRALGQEGRIVAGDDPLAAALVAPGVTDAVEDEGHGS